MYFGSHDFPLFTSKETDAVHGHTNSVFFSLVVQL